MTLDADTRNRLLVIKRAMDVIAWCEHVQRARSYTDGRRAIFKDDVPLFAQALSIDLLYERAAREAVDALRNDVPPRSGHTAGVPSGE